MPVELDHTILCASDIRSSIDFYTAILGFEYAGRTGSFEVVRVNDHLGLDFQPSEKCSSRHLAFVMDPVTFSQVFGRIRDSGMAFGDGPGRSHNMRGPGRSTGTRGITYSVYFQDPNGHHLEIVSYDEPAPAPDSVGSPPDGQAEDRHPL